VNLFPVIVGSAPAGEMGIISSATAG